MTEASRSASQSAMRATRRAVCVLWHPPHEIVDGRLLDAVNRKDLAVHSCTDAAGALAALLRHGRLAITRGEQPPPLILLLYNLDALPAAPLLARTLSRYAPQAICWVCAPSDELLLRALSPADLHTELAARPETEPFAPVSESSPARVRVARPRSSQPEQPRRTGAVCSMPKSTHAAGGRAGASDPARPLEARPPESGPPESGTPASRSPQRAHQAAASAKTAFRTSGLRPKTVQSTADRVTSDVSEPELAMLQDASVRLGNLAQRDQ